MCTCSTAKRRRKQSRLLNGRKAKPFEIRATQMQKARARGGK